LGLKLSREGADERRGRCPERVVVVDWSRNRVGGAVKRNAIAAAAAATGRSDTPPAGVSLAVDLLSPHLLAAADALFLSSLTSTTATDDDQQNYRKNCPRPSIEVRPTALPRPHALDSAPAAGLGRAMPHASSH